MDNFCFNYYLSWVRTMGYEFNKLFRMKSPSPMVGQGGKRIATNCGFPTIWKVMKSHKQN